MNAVEQIRRSLRAASVARVAIAVHRGEIEFAEAVESLAMRSCRLPETPFVATSEFLVSHVETYGEILTQWLERVRTRGILTEMEIARTVRPLIERRKPSVELLTRAGELNESRGRVLTDEEVEDVVVREIAWATRKRFG